MTDKITIEREWLKHAEILLSRERTLEAQAIADELRAALAAQPVAPQPPIDNAFVASGCEQFSSHKSDATRLLEILSVALDECRRLAAVPPAPAAVPLTDAEVYRIWALLPDRLHDSGWIETFARAIERAHGIGDKP